MVFTPLGFFDSLASSSCLVQCDSGASFEALAAKSSLDMFETRSKTGLMQLMDLPKGKRSKGERTSGRETRFDFACWNQFGTFGNPSQSRSLWKLIQALRWRTVEDIEDLCCTLLR